jgi:hypothetical protein
MDEKENKMITEKFEPTFEFINDKTGVKEIAESLDDPRVQSLKWDDEKCESCTKDVRIIDGHKIVFESLNAKTTQFYCSECYNNLMLTTKTKVKEATTQPQSNQPQTLRPSKTVLIYENSKNFEVK